ncbi:MmyB family transcriptional regulator [Nocardiopsis sp. NPDC055551]|uniref:MmyB family transcriptional regulator n=1 Tax=Nocardiopsis sp. JB363 TaxID=1434837 RepID=UPI00097B8221|nr:hypothetical protein [Nocardiopsis sp. JB363]SIO88606.1 putative DNA-binding protein [Nocardiopsis sp. JB363]
MSETSNPLGAFLRARRELVTPEQAGIPDYGARRVPELRCEEVAMLASALDPRPVVGGDIDDPRFIELTGELSLASPRFRDLWARHEVRGQRGTKLRFDHPQVGELSLNRERLSIGGAETLQLVVYHPDAGSTDAEKPALLASADLPTVDAEPRFWASEA